MDDIKKAKQMIGHLLLENDNLNSLLTEHEIEIANLKNEVDLLSESNQVLKDSMIEPDVLRQEISKLEIDLEKSRETNSASLIEYFNNADIQTLKHLFDRLGNGHRDNIGRALQDCD